jgi:hypothetical protein
MGTSKAMGFLLTKENTRLNIESRTITIDQFIVVVPLPPCSTLTRFGGYFFGESHANGR